jgi:hypothetical protein
MVGGQESWAKGTIRQVGVYHLQSGDQAVYVFLHARKSSRFQQYLEQWLTLEFRKLRSDVLSPHVLILPFYSSNWRWYLRGVNEEFEKLVGLAIKLDFVSTHIF